MKLDAESYLKSGSNELRVLEYRACGRSFGINILKVQKIVTRPEQLTAITDTHPCIKGIFSDNGKIIPLIDLAEFLGYQRADVNDQSTKVIITEFFGILNGFLVDKVEWIHHFYWENVIDAHKTLKSVNQKYIISIVKPDGERMVPLLDYETIILDICPDLGAEEIKRLDKNTIDGRGKRILVAEDSPAVRDMLIAELTEVGFSAVSASDGQIAWQLLENEHDFDLVISDIEMPQMDGLALTCAIRNDPKMKELPVIVYSSIGDIGIKARAEFLKANAHVTKLNIEQLLETVQQHIAPAVSKPKSTENRKKVVKK
jgi:two-component system, chemotaxis family, chemotaxis protein CheV